jgi:hypothetical protein
VQSVGKKSIRWVGAQVVKRENGQAQLRWNSGSSDRGRGYRRGRSRVC